jgi:hypothetical protein
MSIRTAIEINHDHHQKQHGEKFLSDLLWAIYHGRPEDWERMRREYGVERVYQCHHSDDRLEAHKTQRHPANFRRTP